MIDALYATAQGWRVSSEKKIITFLHVSVHEIDRKRCRECYLFEVMDWLNEPEGL